MVSRQPLSSESEALPVLLLRKCVQEAATASRRLLMYLAPSVTANAAEADKQEALANGFTDYVSSSRVSAVRLRLTLKLTCSNLCADHKTL